MHITDANNRPLSLADVAGLSPVPETTEPEETRTMSNDPQILITRLRVTNFRGITKLDTPVGSSGVLFAGTNGAGKSSAVEAINAALEGVGIGPECVRLGADKSEILVDLDKLEADRRTKLEVKRGISKKGKTISVTGGDGVPLPKPAEQLAALFGARALDPLKFLASDAKEQRALILAANPVKVTAEDLTRWTGETRDWNTDGHGQEVLARVRKMYFDLRTKAGQAADQAKATLAVKVADADKLRVEKPESMTPEAARTHVAAVERELAVLHDRKRQAAKREQEADGTRARVAAMRAEAEAMLASPESAFPSGEDVVHAEREKQDAWDALQAAERRFSVADKTLDALEERTSEAKRIERDATALCTQANELEVAIAGDDVGDLSEALSAADAAKLEAEATVARAEETARWRAANAEASMAETAKRVADVDWEALDKIVKRLTTEAPAEIAKRADLIEGLEVTPDTILLDGKDIRVLCGQEKMRFAVTLAKRMAGRAKILTVDKLEQVAPGNQPEFVRLCIADGWMLFAAVACDGPLQVLDCYQFSGATP